MKYWVGVCDVDMCLTEARTKKALIRFTFGQSQLKLRIKYLLKSLFTSGILLSVRIFAPPGCGGDPLNDIIVLTNQRPENDLSGQSESLTSASPDPKYVRHDPGNVYLTFPVFWSLHTVSYFIFPSSLSQTTTFHHISPSQVLFLDLRADLGGETIIQEESKPRVIGENCWNILRFLKFCKSGESTCYRDSDS